VAATLEKAISYVFAESLIRNAEVTAVAAPLMQKTTKFAVRPPESSMTTGLPIEHR
jgi:hypothetical protein